MRTNTDAKGQPQAIKRAMSDTWDRIEKWFTQARLAEIVLSVFTLGLCVLVFLSLLRAVQTYEVIGPGPF